MLDSIDKKPMSAAQFDVDNPNTGGSETSSVDFTRHGGLTEKQHGKIVSAMKIVRNLESVGTDEYNNAVDFLASIDGPQGAELMYPQIRGTFGRRRCAFKPPGYPRHRHT